MILARRIRGDLMIDFSLQRENIQTDAFISLPYKNISQGIEKLKQTMSSRK